MGEPLLPPQCLQPQLPLRQPRPPRPAPPSLLPVMAMV
jgi:hypothetical protein